MRGKPNAQPSNSIRLRRSRGRCGGPVALSAGVLSLVTCRCSARAWTEPHWYAVDSTHVGTITSRMGATRSSSRVGRR